MGESAADCLPDRVTANFDGFQNNLSLYAFSHLPLNIRIPATSTATAGCWRMAEPGCRSGKILRLHQGSIAPPILAMQHDGERRARPDQQQLPVGQRQHATGGAISMRLFSCRWPGHTAGTHRSFFRFGIQRQDSREELIACRHDGWHGARTCGGDAQSDK
jgi:hypothetical protein